MDEEDVREREERLTKSLIVRFNLLALAVPAGAFLLVYLYLVATDTELSSRGIKTVVLWLWLGTILVLAREGFKIKNRRPSDARDEAKRTSRGNRPQSPVESWENRKSRQMARELFGAAVILPLLSALFIWLAVALQGRELADRDIKLLTLIVWVGVLAALARTALRLVDRKVIYRQPRGGYRKKSSGNRDHES